MGYSLTSESEPGIATTRPTPVKKAFSRRPRNRREFAESPFGETVVATGPLAMENKFRFSTKYFVDELGMGDWGRRWYRPLLARFISKDPIGERGGLNLYVFVRNMPVGLVDLLGLYTKSWDADEYVTVTVGKCEIIILDGHGDEKKPHTFKFPEGHSCAAGGFLGCYPGTTNEEIPEQNRVPGSPMDHEIRLDIKGSRLSEERKEIINGAESKAKAICSDEKKCCESVAIIVTDTSQELAWYDIFSSPPRKDVVFEYDCEKGILTRKSGEKGYYGDK